jgi:hypothetical protein
MTRDEADSILACRAAGMRGEVWPRTFVSAELAHSGTEVIISPLLNAPDADVRVFSRGARTEESWLSENDENPEADYR